MGRGFWFWALVAGAMAAGRVPAEAQDPAPVASEHSKLNTEDPDPLGKGVAQIQFNFGLERCGRQWDGSGRGTDRGRYRGRGAEVVLTGGVVDELDVAVGFGYEGLADGEEDRTWGHGHSDVALSAKWRWGESPRHGTAFGFVPSLVVPVGDDGTSCRLGPSQECWSAGARFVVVKDWTERWSSNLDAGYELPFGGDRGEARGCLGVNAAVGYQCLSWMQPELELNYGHEYLRGEPDSDHLGMTGGLVLPVSDRLCVRLGIRRDLAGRNSSQETGGLLSIDLNF